MTGLVIVRTHGPNANNNPIRIGSDYGGRYFDGRIDEVKIWDYARTQEEISSTMYTPPSLEQLGLIAYYNFNSGSKLIRCKNCMF